jgi:Undecaprenyl-phosphate galactose phosphotransferase WbaP
LLTLFLVCYWICKLYPGIIVSPVVDLKCVSIANAGVFLLISLELMMSGAPLHFQLTCLIAYIAASAALATVRSLVRQIGSRFFWWGYPVALIGSGNAAVSILHKLKSQPQLGLRPIVLVSDRISAREIQDTPVCRFEHLDRIVSCGVRHAVVAAPELSQVEFAEVLERGSNAFPNIIVIPDTHFVCQADTYACDLAGVLGLRLRNDLLCPEARIAKRVIDLILCVLMAPILLPLMVLIGAWIAIKSGFPVLYSQKRPGYDGRVFKMWKFRTMARNAAEVLEHTLANNPELRKEWTENEKLRNDARITSIGKILRKTSLDELPQFWNVIKGEMSLVGPRPILFEEVAKYREAYSLYSKTTPGITGMWQVSGRNQSTYEERIAYVTYYVRNWSVWLDLYLLAKTVIVVLTGDGAY